MTKLKPSKILGNTLKALLASCFVIVSFYLLALGLNKHSQAKASSLSLGTFTQTGSGAPDCDSGATCSQFNVSCPSTNADAPGYMSISKATTAVRGVVVLFSGADGSNWWTHDGGVSGRLQVVSDMRAKGLTMIQVAWPNGWVKSGRNEQPGPAKLACRPATAIKWIHDNIYADLNIHPDKIGKCGFCVSGNSGGSSQISFSLSFYGLDSIIDAAIPTSGPPHAALAKGCQRLPGQEDYYYDVSNARDIDSSYDGYNPRDPSSGPCASHDDSYAPDWKADSVEAGTDFNYPTTRLHFIFGSADVTVAPAHAQDYLAKLKGVTPYFSQETVSGASHGITNIDAGVVAIEAAILDDTGVNSGQGGSSGGGSGSSSSGGSGSSSAKNHDSQTSDNNKSNPDSSVQNAGDVPSGVLSLITNPTNSLKLIKGPWGWAILIGFIILLGGLAIGGYFGWRYLKKQEFMHRHFPSLVSTKPTTPNEPPTESPEIIEPTDKDQTSK